MGEGDKTSAAASLLAGMSLRPGGAGLRPGGGGGGMAAFASMAASVAPAPPAPAAAAVAQEAQAEGSQAQGEEAHAAASGSAPTAQAPAKAPEEAAQDEAAIDAPAETAEELAERHKRELKELQGKLMRVKKEGAKGGKKAKAEAQAKAALMEAQVEQRHARELAALGSGGAQGAGAADGEQGAGGDGAGRSGGTGKKSKAQKRLEKQRRLEEEREARIAAEKATLGPTQSEREEEKLNRLLRPRGLLVEEIPADGHCMFASVAAQLRRTTPPGEFVPDADALRKSCVGHMRGNREHFEPFVGEDDFEKYCRTMEQTAAWGGQLELGALARTLRRHIKVYTAHLPTIDMGTEFASIQAQPVRVSFHQHAFGLGEHYNSLVPIPGAMVKDDGHIATIETISDTAMRGFDPDAR